MTRDEKAKALRDMDAVIERTERTCQEYELIQMEMMAALAATREESRIGEGIGRSGHVAGFAHRHRPGINGLNACAWAMSNARSIA